MTAKNPFHFSCIGQFAYTITMFITRVTTFCRHAKLWCPIKQLWQFHLQFREWYDCLKKLVNATCYDYDWLFCHNVRMISAEFMNIVSSHECYVRISSAELCRINEHQKVALDLDPYVKKLLNARRRVVLVNNILQNAQVKDRETLNIKHQSCTLLYSSTLFIFSNVCFRNVCGGWTIMLLRRQHEGRPCLRHQEHLPHALPASRDVLLHTFWECTITLCSMPRTNAVDSQNLPHIVKGHWAMQSTATAELMSVHLRVVGETAVYTCTHFFVQHDFLNKKISPYECNWCWKMLLLQCSGFPNYLQIYTIIYH